MGCRIMIGYEQGFKDKDCMVIFFDSVTMTPLSVIMNSEEEAEAFMKWLEEDPRKYKSEDLHNKYYEFLKESEIKQ